MVIIQKIHQKIHWVMQICEMPKTFHFYPKIFFSNSCYTIVELFRGYHYDANLLLPSLDHALHNTDRS